MFDLLDATDFGVKARAYHSLNLTEHEYKKMAELDFVVLTREALLVLEVKGGGVSTHGGVWTFEDRLGRSHSSSEGPFQQARSGLYALMKRLEKALGKATLDRWPIGYGVVFPDTDWRDTAMEWSPQMVADAATLKDAHDLQGFLEALAKFWIAKVHTPRVLGPDVLGLVAQHLRPDFDKVPSLRARANDLEVAMERLTDEQYGRLDIIEDAERILCEGGAGTGKTFLALEVCRREAARGLRVLLVTRGRILAAFLRGRVGGDMITVSPLDELPSIAGPFQCLVVDEGQDLLDMETLGSLERLLVGGLDDGRWRIFYDSNNQAGLYGPPDREALDLLRAFHPSPARLTRNCRNTKQIVLQTRLMTAADLGNPMAGHGPNVDYVYFDDPDGEVRALEAKLDTLTTEGAAPGEITIVCAGDPDAFRGRLSKAWQRSCHPLTEDMAGKWPISNLTISSVRDFKGMENLFVLLVGLEVVDGDPTSVASLYVAMSRARGVLWIAVPERLRADLARVAARNLPAVNADMVESGG